MAQQLLVGGVLLGESVDGGTTPLHQLGGGGGGPRGEVKRMEWTRVKLTVRVRVSVRIKVTSTTLQTDEYG